MAKRKVFRRNLFTDELEEVEIEDFSTRAEVRQRRVTQCFTESKPHRSQAMACRPSQVEEFNERRKREGRTGGRYLPDGTFESYSRKAFNDELKARGLVDGDAAYSTHS